MSDCDEGDSPTWDEAFKDLERKLDEAINAKVEYMYKLEKTRELLVKAVATINDYDQRKLFITMIMELYDD